MAVLEDSAVFGPFASQSQRGPLRHGLIVGRRMPGGQVWRVEDHLQRPDIGMRVNISVRRHGSRCEMAAGSGARIATDGDNSADINRSCLFPGQLNTHWFRRAMEHDRCSERDCAQCRAVENR